MKIGYARVSTKDQNLSLQQDALKNAGCEMIFEEKASGTKSDRPELIALINQLRKDDIVIIWKLDRLGRSLRDLVKLVLDIQDKGAVPKSLHDTTPQGKLTFHLFAALAEPKANGTHYSV